VSATPLPKFTPPTTIPSVESEIDELPF
jgi:hypothetical protein